MISRDFAAHSRRWFLVSLPAALLGADLKDKNRVIPPALKRYADGATEFPVTRLTDPSHNCYLPTYRGRSLAHHGNFLLFASDMNGHLDAFRMDLKSGQARQITDCEDLDPASLAIASDDRTFVYFDGNRVMSMNLSTLKPREVYRIPEGFERAAGLSIAEDSQYLTLVQKNASLWQLQLIHIPTGEATKLAESDIEIHTPLPRPRRASILYHRGPELFLVNYNAQQNYRLRLAEGESGPAFWSPDGRAILYLNFPADSHKLHNIREFIPDTNEDRFVSNTTQFVDFGSNADASVFVGASGSKASPHVLLLVRSVHREMTLAEHRASDPRRVAPIFSPNSQRIYFSSDLHGKWAIYAMSVEKFVEETDSQ